MKLIYDYWIIVRNRKSGRNTVQGKAFHDSLPWADPENGRRFPVGTGNMTEVNKAGVNTTRVNATRVNTTEVIHAFFTYHVACQ